MPEKTGRANRRLAPSAFAQKAGQRRDKPLNARRQSHVRILPYFNLPAQFQPYNPVVVEIASWLCDAIQTVEPKLQLEHVGSTSVPDCGGKGIIDLLVLYPEGFLPRARTVLDELGFQKQGGREPFPESRPMRVGCVDHGGRSFGIHAHVVALGSDEHRSLVWFRDALRASSELRQRYEERKRAILARGIVDSIDYCKAKGVFITDALQGRQFAAPERSSES
jgi:GrpB-like predicted nucleotidyltransferase (UPF0157 family)